MTEYKQVNPNALKTSTEEMENKEKGAAANQRLKDIAKFVIPDGMDYVGTLCVHIGKKEGLRNPIVFGIAQIVGEDMTEDFVITGLSVLRDESMKWFGRNPPAKRKDL